MPARALPASLKATPDRKRTLSKSSVVIIAVELVRLRVVGHEQIDPPIIVEIQERNAERFAGWIVQAGLARDILESAIAQVVKERSALAFVEFRRAIRFVLPIEGQV